MSHYLGLNRRSEEDRRNFDSAPTPDRRHLLRRRGGSDRYVLVVGESGMDWFSLLVGIPAALLIAVAVLSAFVAT